MHAEQLPELGAEGRILEGIVTTYNPDGTVNISPMGPIVDEQVRRLVFRPYRSSTTCRNLQRTAQGVFHVTDDVLLFAQAALGQPQPLPDLEGLVLTDACRWYAFDVQSWDDSREPALAIAETTDQGRHREFFGFNRAKHAVLEAAILATRVHLLPANHLRSEIRRLGTVVEKTAGLTERQAFALLRDWIAGKIDHAGVGEPLP